MASWNGVPRKGPSINASADAFSAQGLRVAVVGGTAGLGRAIARFLVDMGAQVTVVGRTFRDDGVPGLDFVRADFESVAEARRVATLLPAEDLDALVLTTGIITTPQREVTAEGIERDTAVSYLSRFVLVRALADRLGTGRPRRPRLFVMGFPGLGEKGDPDDLNAEKPYVPMQHHVNTVAANEALVLDTAKRFPRLGVFGLNPGLVATNIRANLLGPDTWKFAIVETLIGWLTPAPATYARRVVPAMFAPELEGETGFHLNKKGVPIEPTEAMTAERVAAFMSATEALLARLSPGGAAGDSAAPLSD